jgi:hypothetical protein
MDKSVVRSDLIVSAPCYTARRAHGRAHTWTATAVVSEMIETEMQVYETERDEKKAFFDKEKERQR